LTRAPAEVVTVLRVIARLNIGGPAIQAITLTALLSGRGYRTVLVRGREAPREGTLDPLAERFGVRPVLVGSLRRDIGWHDLRALGALIALLRRVRPQIVHTHAAKAGTVGRLAALLVGGRGITVHTFHGHVLTGYFSGRRAAAFKRIERFLARRTTRLVAVSDEVRDDLVRLDIAPPEQIEVIPLGFDLTPFQPAGEAAARLRTGARRRLGLDGDERVVTLVARLVPIKRVDRFLRIAGLLGDLPGVRFLVVGDGELHGQLTAAPEARELGDRLVWAGFQSDMPGICAASDVVVLTSDNEGTPVSLIEAQAAARPVVSTDVGGVSSVVLDGRTGRVVGPDDEEAFAAAIREILADPERSARLGAQGRRHVLDRFTIERLVDDVDDLYRRLLAEQS